jgi:putative FmdB family regulatory protein
LQYFESSFFQGEIVPIYAYKCGACGHQQDVLQKMSDPALATCPQCGSDTYAKQVTAAGFQLKGSGWYVTDFRNGGGSASASTSTSASGGDTSGAGASAAPATPSAS